MSKSVLSAFGFLGYGWLLLLSVQGAEGDFLPTPTVTPSSKISNQSSVDFPMDQTAQLQSVIFNLDGEDLAANHLTAVSPAGYRSPKLSFGAIPDSPDADGKGMTISLTPGTGYLIVSLDQVNTSDLVRISGTFRASNEGAAIALGALNSPIDNQLAYINLSSSAVPVDSYRRIDLFYAPPNKALQVALQAVVSPFSTDSTTVWVDDLRVETYTPSAQEPIQLEVDGAFENGINKLITNINNTDGTITPFFETLQDVAIRLSIQPSQLAANIGITCKDLTGQFPAILFGGVNVKREIPVPGGQTAMVLTNGFQNIGLFRSTQELPGPDSVKPEYLIVGGDFYVDNPNVPVMIVVQNGGPDVESSIVVDDLTVTKQMIPPTPTPTSTMTPTITPTPTPTFQSGKNLISVNIPGLTLEAKPLEMVYISSGTFLMGSPDEEQDRKADESPQHLITITQPFYIGRFEVTQAQWQSVTGFNPANFKENLNYPVDSISWYDCQEFIKKLNYLGQGTFRLPTEAEWEYACRAGTATRFYWGNDDNYDSITFNAWYYDNSNNRPHEVGVKVPNAWGLYDMSGNVWEWTNDWRGSYPSNTQIDPQGPSTGDYKIQRGGCWASDGALCRSAFRSDLGTPGYKNNLIGVRIVREFVPYPIPTSAATMTPTLTPTATMTPTPTPTFQARKNIITVNLPGLPINAKPLEMVYISPDTFLMGSPDGEQSRKADEGPQHEVTISQPFYLGRFEVTQAQWLAVAGFNPSNFKENLNYPVDSVSWYDCLEFTKKLNNLGQGTFRLPTEAEWEYACRAGAATRFYWGNDDNYDSITFNAWYYDNSDNRPHEVGVKVPNAWGLYDMSGNVWEWTNDWRGSYSNTSQIDPQGPLTGDYKIHRGGCWASGETLCRSAFRSDLGTPAYKNYLIGVRLVREYVPNQSMVITLPNLSISAKPLDMVLVSAGTRIIGSSFDERGRYPYEWVQHEVEISNDFYLSKFEVTQAQWVSIMGYNPSYFTNTDSGSKLNNPVEQVSWYDSAKFCNKLSQLLGLTAVYDENNWNADWNANGFRLPTEAEWEYACRAGTNSRFSFGDSYECLDESEEEFYCEPANTYLWWWNNAFQGENHVAKEVGSKLPNKWGFFDMHGNVHEWCTDWWQESYPIDKQVDPKGPVKGKTKIIRSGSWFSYLAKCRSAARLNYDPADRRHDVGFRIFKKK